MPRVPRIAQIGRIASRGGHAMALSAKRIQIFRHPSNGTKRRVRRVRGGGSMACLASHAEFIRQDRFVLRERERPRRMASETAQDRGGRIQDAVRHSFRVVMTRREPEAVDAAIPRPAHLDVVIGIEAADECGRLQSCAERPLTRLRRFGA